MNLEIWRYIFDAIEDPVFLHDEQFRLLLANRAYCREAGVTEAEALGKPYWEVFPPGAGPLPGCKEAMSKGQTASQEEVSAGAKAFLSTSYSVRDEQGKLLYSLHILRDITAQKQNEAAIIEGETSLRRVIDTARDAIITLDGEDGAITAWNPAADALFGYSAEEVIGRALHEIIVPPRFREAAMKDLAHFATTGEGAAINKTLELVALHRNGTEFPIELSLSTMQIRGKWFATGIARDISARKQPEASLKNMATRYQTVFDASSDAIMLLDETGFTDCNPATLRMFGCSTRDDFISKHPAQFSPATQPGGEDSMSLANERIAAAYKNGSHRFEWMHCRSDGTEFPAEVLLTAMELDGKPLLQATVRDVSERKQADAALKESEARYRQLTESLPLLVWTCRADGECDYLSPQWVAYTGHTEADQLGFGWLQQIHQDDRERLVAAWEASFKQGVAYDIEFRIRRHDGAYRCFKTRAVPLRDSKGRIVKWLGTSTDVDELRQAEIYLARLSHMYRTISLCNQALVRVSDELELCRQMCQVLVVKNGFRAAWVGYADPGAGKRIHPVAVAGMEQGEVEAMNLTWEDYEHGQEPTGTAVRTGESVVSQDLCNDPLWRPWREQAERLSLTAAIAIPLQLDGKTFGVIDIYGAEADEFAPDMRELLAELAGDLAFGIGNLRARAERMGILEKLEHSLDHAVTAIAATVEMRDPYTAGHQRRVAKLAVAIATEMGLPDDLVQGLHMACVVHDIGKIHVPAEILANPAKLSDAEFEIIKTHPECGWEILKGIDFPWPVAEIVHQHHEKMDGSGYPRGLKGDEILLEARILAVADMVEAMSSHRPYRPGFGPFPALQEISRNKGKLYDAKVVEACMRVFMEKNYEW